MTKEGYLNLALKLLRDEIKLGSNLMSKEFKSVAPFGMKKLTDKQRLEMYDSTSIEEFDTLAQEEGEQAVMDWHNEMQGLREKLYGRRI